MKNIVEFNKNSKNKDKLGQYCRECSNQYTRDWYQQNTEYKIQQVSTWCKNNEDKRNINQKRYKDNNEEYIADYKKEYQRRTRKKDIQFKLKGNLRSRLSKALKKNYKSGSAVKDLGCSIEDFKWWLEFWWEEGMNWDNWSTKGWHIDHIKPLDSFNLTNYEELCKACNYKNLQPMWHLDNIKKGNKENF